MFSTPVAVYSAPDDNLPPHRDGVVLLKFKDGISQQQQNGILNAIGATVIKSIGVNVNVVNVGRGRVAQVLQSLKPFDQIFYVEPDYQIVPPDDVKGATPIDSGPQAAAGLSQPLSAAVTDAAGASVLPNDANITSEWAAQNTGQSVDGVTGVAGADERSASAWAAGTGSNSVIVTVLDTGVQYSHPDLLTNIWNNPDGVAGCAAGTHGYNVLTSTCDPMDDDTVYGGHGSHVAGIIGAVGNNAAGVAGVNWTTSIIGVKWVDSNGGGFTSDLVSGMDWVIRAKQAGVNIRVANDSQTWVGTSFSQALSDEIDLLASNDILFVTAAGNTAQNNDVTPRYPCSYGRPGEVCVSASDQNDNLWRSSNYGATSVQLAAPGVNIFSTLRVSNFGFISGCSMAAAQVSGTAALILSKGYLSVSDLRAAILNSVDVLPSFNGIVSTGGRLNVCKALPGCAGASQSTPSNSAMPVVTGVTQAGSVLGASTGIWSGSPVRFAYQWYRCDSNGSNCAVISGATSPGYAVLASADVGTRLLVSVQASNTFGSVSARSSPSAVIAAASSPFALNSTINDGESIGGSLQWRSSPGQSVNFAQFYVDGALRQTIGSSPYEYNQGSTGLFDTTLLPNGTHVLGIRALSSDNRTYGFYGATVTVANAPQNTAPPVISGRPIVGQTLTGSNGSWTNSPTGFSYRWNRCNSSGASCSAISGATVNSYVVKSADAGSTLRVSVTATNSSGSATAQSAAIAVGAGILAVTTSSLPVGMQGTAYSATLNATGGTTPYTWSVITGSLPGGLSLNPTSGAISGTPNATGTSNFTVQVKDGNAQTAVQALSIVIGGGGGTIAFVQSNGSTSGSANASSISAAFKSANKAGNLLVAYVGSYSGAVTGYSITDTAGNIWTAAAPIYGMAQGEEPIQIFYAANCKGGGNTVTAHATGDSPQYFILAIHEYSGIATSSPLDQTAAAFGYSGSSLSVRPFTTTSSNELIFVAAWAGAVTSAGSGYQLRQTANLSGMGTEDSIANNAGTYTATMNTTGSWDSMVATFRAGSSGPPPLTVTTSSLPVGMQGTAYSATLNATGGTTPYTWSVITGSLPGGLSLNPTSGAISGTPNATGTSNFTVQVKDGNAQTAVQALSIVIGGGGGTIAFVQSNGSTSGSANASSISAAFKSANKAGNLLVAYVGSYSGAVTGYSITDTAGNIWTAAAPIYGMAQGEEPIQIFYAANCKGGGNTVTAHATGDSPQYFILAIHEYSGIATSSPLDQTAAAFGYSGSSLSVRPFTTTSSNELIFVAAWAGAVTSAGSGYQLRQTANLSGMGTEDSIANNAGTYTATMNTTGSWDSMVATFRAGP
jgi:subtilisin family serine protease/membrane protein YqaA with SNARE-associated domain